MSGVELAGEGGDLRRLIAGHGDDDIVRREALFPGGDHVFGAVRRHAVDADSGAHGQFEAGGVLREIVRHLVLRRKAVRRCGKGHPDETIEARGREEPERIPALPPAVADACVRLEDDARNAAALEQVCDRQTGLTTTDDNGVEVLRGMNAVHLGDLVNLQASLIRVPTNHTTLNAIRTRTVSPCPFAPRTCFGTGSRVRPDFSRHTLVLHVAAVHRRLDGRTAPALRHRRREALGHRRERPAALARDT